MASCPTKGCHDDETIASEDVIMVNFPVYIDTISMDSSILYFRVHSLNL